MKRIFLILMLLSFAWRLPAQTNEAAKLALIAESDEVAAFSDVLTAQLSGNANIHLLERNDIEKVYREQALSVANKDYLKLGQIWGRMDCCCLTWSKPSKGRSRPCWDSLPNPLI